MSFNFIDYFLDFTSSAESPTEFFRWAALAAIAATARDNVYLENDVQTVYPNIYVIIYARSGAARKSVPLKKVNALLAEIKNTHLIQGRTSIQHAIKKLGEGFTNQAGEIVSGASGMLYTEELASFFIADPSVTSYLTDLYDFHEEWDSSTISHDVKKLERVCLTMLAATNEKLFRQVYGQDAIYGGLLSRTLIIQADAARRKNSLVYNSIQLPKAPLITHLFKISKLKGAFTWSPDAAHFYDAWYNRTDFGKNDSQTGLEWRLDTHIKKISLLLALAEEDLHKVIQRRHVEQAMDMVLDLIPNYRMISSGAGVSSTVQQNVIILQALLKRGTKPVTKTELMRNHWSDLDFKTFGDVVETLIASGLIARVFVNNQDEAYHCTEAAIENYLTGE